ncbi:hypothetical protein CBS63078_1024 [Aspergillus niger]|uniref:Contig An15c0080, genomic contig n=3 Tax=Aspergillus niger TaxID=5061 RepID=A2R4P9_ASPNC|nr:uncharacterized protein An15g01170 [Aspergillus niger]XP_025452399.1 uncharacterized protein BO96DRAFT_414201 [Aspergillus niger CBS 101883]RDH22575.1 hypothetical protein M747DRAFT_294171 [Aspergillus niger ATCC 13496]KAI2818395.1 hypothetical protein CBS115989_5103 [Aspergillus niger]KAI2832265.1 hypothetical protein CBS133816_1749 [Aspergillus niger]KAI2843472.1 hypothetical protein CBS11350_5341 [Aspergillus niger]KAI2848925.1 hypothetical protein CBS11232_6775 [Aspergillus niger]|eukprot:XP_001396657.1 pre-mRNA-splicing factor cwc21 [Aspergillus niger CBS 513.88]
MSSNVGLSTPRGSGTSGYVQRNFAFMKPRNAGYGAPYPPISGSNSADPSDKPFKQRQPDKQILEHDRRRAIEVKVMEERERLEEENERIEEELESKQKKKQKKGGDDDDDVKKEEGEEEEEGERVLTEEEIEERCEALRKKLVKEMEEEDKERERGGGGNGGGRRGRRAWDLPPKERRQFKSYQVHELAEAKIEESERLRRALGIKEEK